MNAVALLVAGFLLLPAAQSSATGMAAPAPAKKPLAYESRSIAGESQPVSLAQSVPLPAVKPDFGRPDITQLLSFGQPPVPKKRPMPGLRKKLSDEDAELYKKIFAYQAHAEWDKADVLLSRLNDFRLRGYILQQRFLHPTSYRSDFDELVGWMDLYADLPNADKVYKLALARMPKSFKGEIRHPVKAKSMSGMLGILADRETAYISPKNRTAAQRAEIKRFEKQIRADLSRGGPTRALKRLKEDKAATLLDTVEYDQVQAQIANSFMLVGKLGKAMELSRAAVKRSGNKVPQAGWIGGLTAWRQGDYKLAAQMFESAATSPYSSDWTASANAYWTSRALLRAGKIRQVTPWLERAAAYPRTFYGLIATRALGMDFDFNWAIPAYTPERKQMLAGLPAVARAEILVAAGQHHLAEAELRRVNPGDNIALREALLAYADHAGLPSFAMRVAQATASPEGALYDAALYPLCPWEPQNGYKVDRALINALIRQESRFNPTAESRSGATGLMQLMPATASYVAGSRRYKNREGQFALRDPQINLDIGQRYVETLMDSAAVEAELFSLVAAYNAGPGNLANWKKQHASMKGDPLLFIESIPLAETRNFIERVMANYWIYRLRLDQPTPSLDAVTEGRWARYVALDDGSNATPIKKAEADPAPEAPYVTTSKRRYN